MIVQIRLSREEETKWKRAAEADDRPVASFVRLTMNRYIDGVPAPAPILVSTPAPAVEETEAEEGEYEFTDDYEAPEDKAEIVSVQAPTKKMNAAEKKNAIALEAHKRKLDGVFANLMKYGHKKDWITGIMDEHKRDIDGDTMAEGDIYIKNAAVLDEYVEGLLATVPQ